jgi:peptidoglycan/LPS O-acetylase OafA/YrhL
MFGTLRLFLALLVAISHVHFRPFGLNPGVIAVIVFYLLSGYVMTAQLRTRFQGLQGAPRFFTDRLLRVYPQYLLFLLVTSVLVTVADVRSDFVSSPANAAKVFFNVTVIPLNYYMFIGLENFLLIPPAWSLGTELQFYALIPFLLRWRRMPAIAGSLVVLSFAWFGVINTDWFGYRLLPGVLFIFLTGSLLYDYVNGNEGLRHWLILLYGGVCILFLATINLQVERIHYREVFYGYAIGVPLVYLLSCAPRNAIDDTIGAWSYGTFLSHFAVLWTAEAFHLFGPTDSLWMYLSLSVMLGALGFYFVELPITRIRHRLLCGIQYEGFIREAYSENESHHSRSRLLSRASR